MVSTFSDAMCLRIDAGKRAVLSQVATFHAGFGKAVSHWKHDGTRVTDFDVAISEAIFGGLRSAFPGDDFFSEELPLGDGPVARRGEWSWVLDPIDGTNNYALGLPVAAISLGLLRDGEPVYGFIYDFGRRAILHGGAGRGIWEDEERIHANLGRATKQERIVALHSPVNPQSMPAIEAVLANFKLRGYGSGTLHLAYAALGIVDVCLDFTVKVWDIAAAAAFCKETGAEMRYFGPSAFPLQTFDLKMKPLRFAAGHSASVDEVVEALKASGWKP